MGSNQNKVALKVWNPGTFNLPHLHSLASLTSTVYGALWNLVKILNSRAAVTNCEPHDANRHFCGGEGGASQSWKSEYLRSRILVMDGCGSLDLERSDSSSRKRIH